MPTTQIQPDLNERIALIFNPHAATNRRRCEELTQLAAGQGIDVEVTTDLDALSRVADRLAARPPAALAVAGGDGTISHAVTAMRQRLGDNIPPLIALPGGSMNMVANSLGMPRIDHAIAALTRNDWNTAERATMQIGSRFGFIFGLGLVTNFLELYYAGTTTGPRRAAAVTAKVVGSALVGGQTARQAFRRTAGHLRVDGDHHQRPWTVVLAMTIANFGIGFRPAWRAETAVDRFHLLATDLHAAGMVRHLDYIRRGRPWPERARMIDAHAREAIFRPAEAPLIYTIDGDLYQSDDELHFAAAAPTTFLIPRLPV
ncbi:MAG: hypothetical protein D6761_13470 [Candidatus Dadabacteria bacterium]|nr:MAG: hypothetical protein D6761_13470 [Candidatus Dadabacteria bacterium]